MPGTEEQRDSPVVPSAGDPGPLSRLLQELFEAPGEDHLEAWKNELQPGSKVGRFEIRREVGRGGFGAVYEAFDTELNRVVAVKTLRLSRPRRDLSSDWIKREAEAVARLDHPGIVTLFDVGTCDSGPYLVMELLRGKTLAQRIAEGPIPQAEALRIAEGIAKGLAHAHQRGVLHRDLKPANVFLCEDGRVKLLDFGLAHLLGTEGVSGAGTPAYMAPEQARGGEVDLRADVYAAGRVLGDMLGEKHLRRLDHAIALATSADPTARPRDGQAWLDLLQTARHAVERPARMRRVAVLAGLGVVLGGLVVGVAVHRASRPEAGAHGKPSIAVLPFRDLSADKDQGYLADGLAEEILDALTSVEGLKVIGRASSFLFRDKDVEPSEVARRLGVSTLLEGSLRREGNRIKVGAELVNGADGARMWSRSYERDIVDVFALQEEIAADVARSLRTRLVADAPPGTVVPEAYRQYLLAIQITMADNSVDELRRSMAALERAVALDPRFAKAWARLAPIRASIVEPGQDPWSMGGPYGKAREAAARAIELAPNAGEGYSARGYLRMMLDFDWSGAMADLEKAHRLNPSDGLAVARIGLVHAALGRLSKAIQSYERAAELDPLRVYMHGTLADLKLWSGELGGAMESARRSLEISPRGQGPKRTIASALLLQGHVEEAVTVARSVEDENLRLYLLGLASRSSGPDPELQGAADAYLERFQNESPGRAANVAARHGRTDEAFRILNLAIDKKRIPGTQAGWLRSSPFLRGLHSDPRWAEVLRKMNLPVD